MSQSLAKSGDAIDFRPRAKRRSSSSAARVSSAWHSTIRPGGWLTATCRAGCGRSTAAQHASSAACPHCGHGEKLDVNEWAACLLDGGFFAELDSRLSLSAMRTPFQVDAEYRDALLRAHARSGYGEALVTGHETLRGTPVAVALSNFHFIGGSMEAVTGEKLARVAAFARSERMPLVSVSCSGGACMQEGTLALLQMAKVNLVLIQLAEAGIPFISVIASPTMGGTLASYITQGAVILAEPRAQVSFAGPRVVRLAGIRLPEYAIRAEFLRERGGIHEVCPRKEMRTRIAHYLDFYRATAPRSRHAADRSEPDSGARARAS